MFALAVGGAASSAAAHPVLSSAGFAVKHVFHTFHGAAKTLYSQNSNDSGVGLVSDNFTSGSFTSYDDSGADDFIVPSGKTWKIKVVDVTGVYFNGSGPATSENVTFYNDNNGVPGSVVKAYTGLSCVDSSGSFSCKIKKTKLKAGHYWVAVVANMNFSGGAGEWGWEGNTVINNDPAQWENPGGGFGVCPTWGSNSTCLGYNQDDMFDLKT